ncbi:MAG TPA: response regulator transcription factor [Saprospiraceae bacterium]|nr:response regulator transcription factor [Saprospiraceae bacterium]
MDRKKILIVEDDDMLRKSLTFFLTKSGYDITEIDNGMDAIECIQSNQFEADVVITDLNLPFAGGKQIIKVLKENFGDKIPLIVLTSSGIESTELEILSLGADDFVSKPFSPAVLLKRIEKQLI